MERAPIRKTPQVGLAWIGLLSCEIKRFTMKVDDSKVSAIQLEGSRIEYHKPDLGLAYSALAPKVSEAWAFLRCGKIDEAKKAMAGAQAVIDAAAMQSATIELVGDGSSR
jgi:hypothetical protein